MIKLYTLLAGLAICSGVLSDEVRISSAAGLIDFSKAVNTGKDYSGTTVLLDADIEFTSGTSSQFEIIGDEYEFLGTFDGQGHKISNLKINATATEYVGLFGLSSDITIRGLVIDSTCSITYSHTDNADGVKIGSVIGELDQSATSVCLIENIVNMGSVFAVSDEIPDVLYLHIGGIAGMLTIAMKTWWLPSETAQTTVLSPSPEELTMWT